MNNTDPAAALAELRAENEMLKKQLSITEGVRAMNRFHAFDAIKNDACPSCGGRVRIVETHNAVRLEAE